MGVRDERLSVNASVAIRPEPFGALAYHYGNRRLTFLKRPELVAVVRRLDGTKTLEEVFGEVGIPNWQWPAFEQAVERLMDSDMIHVDLGGAVDAS